jgi:hypothetical protein
MANKNFHTNIMLDLECAAIDIHNPAIIQIDASYFDIDTGREIRKFSTHVNLQSCLYKGLVTDEDTLQWLQKNIPKTLVQSKKCLTSLPLALERLSKWLRICSKDTKEELHDRGQFSLDSQLMIWANGANADNIWIHSAYKACKMPKP